MYLIWRVVLQLSYHDEVATSYELQLRASSTTLGIGIPARRTFDNNWTSPTCLRACMTLCCLIQGGWK